MNILLRFFIVFLFLGTPGDGLLAETEAREKTRGVLDPLYVKTFGKSSNKPLIFLHGGPGFFSQNFEVTTAPRLASEGYFVVVYDRRGTGFSPKAESGDFSFATAVKDLSRIIQFYQLKDVTLLGHSFGGTVALNFLDAYPEGTDKVVLIGSPLSYPTTLKTILNTCLQQYPLFIDHARKAGDASRKKMFEAGFRQTKLMVKALFDERGRPINNAFSEENVNFVFTLALNFSLYSPKELSGEAKNLYQKASAVAPPPPSQDEFPGFMKNERYALLDLGPLFKKHAGRLYGIYGSEDGLFSPEDLGKIRGLLGAEKLALVTGASHNVFIDQQETFVQKLKEWLH